MPDTVLNIVVMHYSSLSVSVHNVSYDNIRHKSHNQPGIHQVQLNATLVDFIATRGMI
jgi:hypothetical protein